TRAPDGRPQPHIEHGAEREADQQTDEQMRPNVRHAAAPQPSAALTVTIQLPSDPVPSRHAADQQTYGQQHQRPGELAARAAIEPHAYRHAQQRRRRDRPANDAGRPEASADVGPTLAARAQLFGLFARDHVEEFVVFLVHRRSPRRLKASASSAMSTDLALLSCSLTPWRRCASADLAFSRSPATTAR